MFLGMNRCIYINTCVCVNMFIYGMCIQRTGACIYKIHFEFWLFHVVYIHFTFSSSPPTSFSFQIAVVLFRLQVVCFMRIYVHDWTFRHTHTHSVCAQVWNNNGAIPIRIFVTRFSHNLSSLSRFGTFVRNFNKILLNFHECVICFSIRKYN